MTPALPAALQFVTPPPGLEPAVDFVLAGIDNTPGLFSVTAGNGGARLFVLDAAVYLPDYIPRLPAADLAAIGAEAGDAVVLVVVNPGSQSTVNLAAPMLLNPVSGACVQVILEGTDWPLRAPLAPAGESA
jgi:flagellar assembly factor FliW